tara:strand:+ start:2034 stop:2240 length:207 start_codon:yes stop_codon:yes gene_type:complete
MSTERVLENNILVELRNNNVITSQEVAIQIGDLYFAKDVITDKRRVIEINNLNTSINETKTNKQLLKG